MHDTFLLNKISKMIEILCNKNKIKKISYLKIIVNLNSHVNVSNLTEHLLLNNKELIQSEIKIDIIKDNIEEQTAIIETIQGD